MKAIWNNQIIAESDETVVVESNHYFPASSLKHEFFKASSKQSTCYWKGIANYYDIVVGDEINQDAAWFYPETKEKANPIKGMVAFWRGVQIVE